MRGEVLRLLNELQKNLKITYIFVTHDLEVVRAVADEIVVMYRGEIVEQAPADSLFRQPCHPYTKALLAASELERDRFSWAQRSEQPAELDGGCRMRDRCPLVQEKCSQPQPLLSVEPHHQVRCWAAVPN